MTNNRSRYVFGAALAGVAMGGLPGLVERAEAATAAAFTFETSGLLLDVAVTGPVSPALVAESGAGTAIGSHLAASTVYSSPGGNGSANSFSSNNWTAGDYYQFSVPTTGLEDIMVSFDQGASSTGPKVFSLAFSPASSIGFTNFTSYTIVNMTTITSTVPAGSVTATTNFGSISNPGFNISFDLSTVTALDNAAGATFRLINADTTTATGGTNRVDNFIVTGTPIPEPAGLALATVALGALATRRRRV